MSKPVRNAALGLLVLLVAAAFVSDMPSSLLRSVLLGAIGGAAIWLLLPMFTGKVSLRTASAADRERLLADAVAPAGQGLLYVYRGGYVGMTTSFDVQLDGRSLAGLKSPRYLRTPIQPGEHSLRVGPGGLAGKTNTPGLASFTAQPGETVIFAISSETAGVASARTVLTRELDVPAAIDRMAAMKLVPTTP